MASLGPNSHGASPGCLEQGQPPRLDVDRHLGPNLSTNIYLVAFHVGRLIRTMAPIPHQASYDSPVRYDDIRFRGGALTYAGMLEFDQLRPATYFPCYVFLVTAL